MKVSEQKRLSIIAAAQQEFKQRGFAGASMDRIAESAQVSKRTIYNHFSSKEILFKEILSRLVSSIGENAAFTYRSDMPLAEQLKRIASNEVELLCSAEFTELANVIFIELARMPELKEEMVSCLPGCENAVIDWLNAAEEDGRMQVKDKPFAAQQFIFAIKSFIFYPQLFGWTVPDRERIEFIINENISMFLKYYEV